MSRIYFSSAQPKSVHRRCRGKEILSDILQELEKQKHNAANLLGIFTYYEDRRLNRPYINLLRDVVQEKNLQ